MNAPHGGSQALSSRIGVRLKIVASMSRESRQAKSNSEIEHERAVLSRVSSRNQTFQAKTERRLER